MGCGDDSGAETRGTAPASPAAKKPLNKAAPSKAPGGSPTMSPAQYLDRAQAHLLSNEVLDVIVLLDKAVKEHPQHPALPLALGAALMENTVDKNLEEALQRFQDSEKLGFQDARVWQAHALIELDRNAQARKRLRPFVDDEKAPIRPFLADAFFQHARLDLADENWEGAQQHLERALQIVNECATLGRPLNALERARILGITRDADGLVVEITLGRGDHAKAEELAHALAVKLPESTDVRKLYSRVLERAGKTEQSAKQSRAGVLLEEIEEKGTKAAVALEDLKNLYDELDGIEPRSPRTRLRFARHCMGRGELPMAMEACREFRKNTDAPSKLQAEAWFLEGKLFLQGKRYDEALQCLEEALKLEPGFGPQFEQLKRNIEAERDAAK